MFLRIKKKYRGVLVFVLLAIIIFSVINTKLHNELNVEYAKLEKQKMVFELRQNAFDKYQFDEVNMTDRGSFGKKLELTEAEKKVVDEELNKEGFSEYLNSVVSLDRSLADYRPHVCKNQHYPEDLPTASVIIIFCNELPRVIFRTIHSVINRTPPRYLKDIIVVDDASDRGNLRQTVEDHINQNWPSGLVRLISLPVRSGLIRARLTGIMAATGEVFVTMDAHMEATKGWIEPLLSRIKENNKTLLAPMVDAIEPKDLHYIRYETIIYQTFTWNMEYLWTFPPDGVVYDPLKPLPTYALVGCIMVMNKAMFLEMGSYDAGMTVWGGENVELPIRMWMCGGRVEIIPCSRVGHTYRVNRPWKSNSTVYFQNNIQRIAEVWLDEYKDEFYILHPNLRANIPAIRANITERLKLRERLHCKSFSWFVNFVVQPPMFMYTRNVTNQGQLKNTKLQMCMDTFQITPGKEAEFGVYSCNGEAHQVFALSFKKQLRRHLHCVSFNSKTPGGRAVLTPYCKDDPSQRWSHDLSTMLIKHEMSGLCLDSALEENKKNFYIILTTCGEGTNQKWLWDGKVEPRDAA